MGKISGRVRVGKNLWKANPFSFHLSMCKTITTGKIPVVTDIRHLKEQKFSGSQGGWNLRIR